MMIHYSRISWWYWAISTVLLGVGLAGRAGAFCLAMVLAVVQIVHFTVTEKSIKAFPVQVRAAYLCLLAILFWEPLRFLYWIPFVGTIALVFFGYCFLARCLSLTPWNRKEPLTRGSVKRAFFSAPIDGNVMHGLSQ
jgi:hypothetical protein